MEAECLQNYISMISLINVIVNFITNFKIKIKLGWDSQKGRHSQIQNRNYSYSEGPRAY